MNANLVLGDAVEFIKTIEDNSIPNPEYFEFAKKRIEQAKENNRFLFKELAIEEGSNICNPNLNHI